MKFYFFILLLSLCPASVTGQNPGPRLTAMGSGGTAATGIWALQQNPAGISVLKKPVLAIAFEQAFINSEVSTQTAVFAVPSRLGVVGACLARYGFSEYKEQSVGLFYAKSFGNLFNLAIGLKHFQLNIPQYGTAGTYTVELGMQVRINDKLTIASHIANPSQSRYNAIAGANLPVKLSLGGSYKFSDRLLIIIDLRKMVGYPLDGMTGIEYTTTNWFSLRGGVSAYPFRQYAGFGINYKKTQLDFSIASHISLGLTPQISLAYEF